MNTIGHQGDILILKVSNKTTLPKGLNEVVKTSLSSSTYTVMHGEGGHAHVLPFDNSKIRIFLEPANDATLKALRLVVTEPVALTHETHAPVILEPGTYITKSKREWSYGAIHPLVD